MSADGRLIFVVGRPRTGTTVFRHLLADGGAVDCGEVLHNNMFKDTNFFVYLAERVAKEPKLVHPTRHVKAFHDYVGAMRERFDGAPLVMDVKMDAFGRIHRAPGVQTPAVVSIMQERAHTVFNIVRRNRLRALTSAAISREVGVWYSYPERLKKAEGKKTSVSLKVETLKQRLNAQAHEDERFAAHFEGDPRYVRLEYEDMFAPDGGFAPGVMAAARAALDVDALPNAPAMVKMNPEPLSALLSNFDDIAEALRDTRHAWMLDT